MQATIWPPTIGYPLPGTGRYYELKLAILCWLTFREGAGWLYHVVRKTVTRLHAKMQGRSLLGASLLQGRISWRQVWRVHMTMPHDHAT